MHDMLIILTDVCVVCLSVCPSVTRNRRRHVRCKPRAMWVLSCVRGHSVEPLSDYFGHSYLFVVRTALQH